MLHNEEKTQRRTEAKEGHETLETPRHWKTLPPTPPPIS